MYFRRSERSSARTQVTRTPEHAEKSETSYTNGDLTPDPINWSEQLHQIAFSEEQPCGRIRHDDTTTRRRRQRLTTVDDDRLVRTCGTIYRIVCGLKRATLQTILLHAYNQLQELYCVHKISATALWFLIKVIEGIRSGWSRPRST